MVIDIVSLQGRLWDAVGSRRGVHAGAGALELDDLGKLFFVGAAIHF